MAADRDGLHAPDAGGLLAACPDALFLVNRGGALRWANPAAEALIGITLADGAGRNALDYVHPDDAELAALALVSMHHKSVGTLLELRIATETGWRLVEVRGAAFGDDVLMTVRDLTDRRRWEVTHDHDARLRSLVQNGAALTLLLDADARVATSSGALSRLLGIDQEWVESRPLAAIVDAADRDVLADTLQAVRAATLDTRRRTVEVRLRTARGDTVPFSLTITNLLDDPTVAGFVVTGHDISDRVAAEHDLRRANSLLTATLEATADGILVIDLNGRITSINPRFEELFGIDESDADGFDGERRALGRLVTQMVDPDAFMVRVREVQAAPGTPSHDVLHLVDGRIIERDSLPQLIDGEIVGRVWSFRDVTEHHRLQQELAYQALHDRLTGLANQALFRDRVEHATARRHATPSTSAVLFVDLDNFKDVNDSLGHAAGDALLVAVTQRLIGAIRPGDTAARLGGDEFAVFIDDVATPDDALAIAQRILDALRAPFTVASTPITTTASVGVAFGAPGTDADALLRNADLAMYSAKAAGKGCYRVYVSSMHAEVLDRLDLEHALPGASRRGELLVHYQPILELRTGRIAIMEALVRWRHPQRGLLAPDAFIGLAERSGAIDEVGEHVLRRACEEAVRWERVAGRRAPLVSVNLSPVQLLDDELPERIITLLDDVGLSPDRLVLEITEGALMRDPGTVATALDQLRGLGVQLAVDDFGTGYSSLAYLHQFPLHMLKIDRAFVDELRRDDDALMHAIVQLAHTLHLVPVAEGVETAAQATTLARLGCELAQGFHLGRPMSADAARALVGSGPLRLARAS